jgi:GH24 family phage-related lysozyme (muramidase)
MAGLAFTVSYERFVDRAYNDRPGRLGNCTAGYGHLLHRGPCTPSDFNAYRTVSRERALGWLYEDVNNAARTLRGEVGRTPLHQREFDALSDLVFNIGAGYFSKSNVKLDLLATPPRYRSVPKDLLSLVNGHGVKLCGLYRRRVDNGRTFVSGTYARTYATCPPGHV